MICYMDMTFCPYYKECARGDTCGRALTPEVEKKADKWWPGDKGTAPICQYAEKPDCFEPKEGK